MAAVAPLRIAYDELVAFARGNGFWGRPFSRFAFLIDAQDDVFLAHHAEQQKRAREGTATDPSADG